ncbi:serine hydrolase [Mucilaginibacter pedocola]|nr:serine hydrolase [Mucilaginibacter pedocola]
MKNILCFLFSFLTVASLKAQTEKQLQTILEDNGLPGIQLACTVNGKTTAYNLGTAKAGLKKPVTSATIFRAGSLGKTVFAYAVLRLCDRGVLSLDTPLMRYIGSYNRYDPKDPRYSMITARMVLSHTSGLAEFPDFETGEPVRLLFAPGSGYSYSGEGYWFLQKVVEKITAMPFEQLMQQEVFKPLGMQSSTYVQSNNMDAEVLGPVSPDLAPMLPNAAFSLLTNAHDYNVFLQNLLAGKGLKPATQKLMFSRQTKTPSAADTDKTFNWGLGVGLEQGNKQNLIWHWGKTDDFISLFVANPGKGQSLVFFTRGKALKAADQIVSLFLGRQTALTMRAQHFRYDNPDAMPELFAALRKHGFDDVSKIFNGLARKGKQFSEADLNYYGNVLLKQGKNREALAIFKQQATLFPQSPLAYSRVAAAAENLGGANLALTSYRKALMLDSTNVATINHIKALEKGAPTSTAHLKMFEGKYKRADNGMFLDISAVGNKLVITQSWDGGQLEFFRVDEFDFYNEEPGFTLKFTKDEQGRIWKAFVNDRPLEWVRK